MTIKYFILMVHSFFSPNLYTCVNNQDTSKLTVVGIAIVNKAQAAVRTEDSVLYYLYGVDDWDVKFKGKKVKVTGEVMTLGEPVTKSPNPAILAPPQPYLRDGVYLIKAKWKLVK